MVDCLFFRYMSQYQREAKRDTSKQRSGGNSSCNTQASFVALLGTDVVGDESSEKGL